ncbi:hypothetical protein ACVWQR_04320 [Neisseria meningitidis]
MPSQAPRLPKCRLPGPPPRGRERVSADFSVAGDLKGNVDLQWSFQVV